MVHIAVKTIAGHKWFMMEDAQMKLRLPVALKRQIEAAALESNRSLNGEIVSRLEASFPDYIPDAASVRRGPRHDTIEKRLDKLESRIDEIMEILSPKGNADQSSTSLKLLKNMKSKLSYE
ncbi:Arc family DNA-binding protein [Brucella ciceri]